MAKSTKHKSNGKWKSEDFVDPGKQRLSKRTIGIVAIGTCV
jgi:hypothetical protein